MFKYDILGKMMVSHFADEKCTPLQLTDSFVVKAQTQTQDQAQGFGLQTPCSFDDNLLPFI